MHAGGACEFRTTRAVPSGLVHAAGLRAWAFNTRVRSWAGTSGADPRLPRTQRHFLALLQPTQKHVYMPPRKAVSQ